MRRLDGAEAGGRLGGSAAPPRGGGLGLGIRLDVRYLRTTSDLSHRGSITRAAAILLCSIVHVIWIDNIMIKSNRLYSKHSCRENDLNSKF
jgi:hypothetical protein